MNTLHSISTILLYLTILLFNCVIPTEPLEEKLTFTIHSDTVSPFSSIMLCFSSPIDDSINPELILYPQFYHYYQSLNSSKDTLTIFPTVPFSGNTHYKIRAQEKIRSQNNTFLSTTDSAIFFTYPLEHEPNNSTVIADSVDQVIFGTISSVNDTDYFQIGNTEYSHQLSFKSFGSRTFFHFQDLNGTIISVVSYQDSLIVPIPDSIIKPLYLAVYSYRKSCGGYYQVQLK